ncbi:MAG: DUF2807 domain-containing protein [Rikenellaceae bacterium]|nr:DUF2807 domain-containing protein [Rikenellaceae bacterium]
MRRILFAILALGAIHTISAAEPKPQTLDIDQMKGFHTIRISGTLSVEVVSTEANPAMHLELRGNDRRRFDWSVRDSVLNISFGANSKSPAQPMLTVWTPTPIEQLTIKRSDVKLYDTAATPLLDVTLQEGARLSGEVVCQDLRLDMSGRSVAEIEGQATYQTINVRGKSALKADRVESKSVDLNAKGSSEVYVNATERAVLESKTHTSVFYNGNPTIVRTRTKLSATINSIGAR